MKNWADNTLLNGWYRLKILLWKKLSVFVWQRVFVIIFIMSSETIGKIGFRKMRNYIGVKKCTIWQLFCLPNYIIKMHQMQGFFWKSWQNFYLYAICLIWNGFCQIVHLLQKVRSRYDNRKHIKYALFYQNKSIFKKW